MQVHPRRSVRGEENAGIQDIGARWRRLRGRPLYLLGDVRHVFGIPRAAGHRRVRQVSPRHPKDARCQRR